MKPAATFLGIAIVLLLSLAAQTTKLRLLDAQDGVTGDWEWVKDPVGNPFMPFPDQQWTYIRFSAGKELSFGALTWSEDKGYGGVSRFVAWTDGAKVTGTLSESSTVADKGKKFSFAYRLEGYDQLVITVNEEEYFYKKKP